MGKSIPIIFMMFGLVMTPLIILGIAAYYGESDWIYIAQTVTLFMLVLIVFGTALFTLRDWIRR